MAFLDFINFWGDDNNFDESTTLGLNGVLSTDTEPMSLIPGEGVKTPGLTLSKGTPTDIKSDIASLDSLYFSEDLPYFNVDIASKSSTQAIDKIGKQASAIGSSLEDVNKRLKTAENLTMAKMGLEVVGSLSGLLNIGSYRLERDNAKLAVDNQLSAAQNEILENLSYNTDQSIVYAARGNVNIGSGVLTGRMQKGATEAGKDFAMLRANADIQKANADINYTRKKRAAVQGVLNSITNVGLTGLMYGMGKSSTPAGSLNEMVYNKKSMNLAVYGG